MVMSRSLKPLLGVCLSMMLLSLAALADTTLRGEGDLTLTLSGGRQITMPGGVTAVQGTISIRPQVEPSPGTWTHFVVDGRSHYATNSPLPVLKLDTTQLPEGKHTLRVDSMAGERRMATSGDVVLEVANAAAFAQLAQAAPDKSAFVKLHHKKILREIVWFNGREGDLETHGTIRRGHILITLTDLMRHLGGTVDWGPPGDLILASRNNVHVRIIPGSATAYVNGRPARMPVAAFRKGNRTYVPIRAMCGFFGVRVDWDYDTDRAYVTYQLQ